ncbi:ATPase MORC2B-like [Impatiens glandulifera]|uniref:ATPase MORC2B-like n=1 Tax=Impatiens glandulifera TaxID=253017 RepID=UPI001FB15812|nr:ATPase MORC2B-like [Impatiens glandulifera]XP_047314906.1 ATPase MORC2B-like [Impatiens glandulifera]XP_047314907.1 ATPase MORC2B-like [Impatiens glandulifera]
MGSSEYYVSLMKDEKIICRGVLCNLPDEIPRLETWKVQFKTQPKEKEGFRELKLYPAPENDHQKKEWRLFLGFLQEHRKKVAFVEVGGHVFDIHPPGDLKYSHAVVRYQTKKEYIPHYDHMHYGSCKVPNDANSSDISCNKSTDKGVKLNSTSEAWVKSVDSPAKCFPNMFKEVTGNSHAPEVKGETFGMTGTEVDGLPNRNYIQMHPSYLKTLGQAHSDWIFGAIAELVDNARDAKSTKLEISIEMVHSKVADEEIPMLCITDDGLGMNYVEIARMLSFGHQQPDVDDPERTGRFGVGFKTGAMRIGKDALVLTQTTTSRSIAFLSQSLNDGKSNLEIPIVSYHRKGQHMEVDTNVQTKDLAKCNLKSIETFSPFNKYFIGVKSAQFNANGTGTQLFIWNLDKWGSDYFLEWLAGETAVRSSSDHQGDIFIRSRKIRSRPGQTSHKVPLDYSLRSYLELIFLDPRMKIFVQGSLVKSRPLAKSLEQTVIKDVSILGKPVQLILGRCQLEWEQANCGFFLYWHGRLIEAYKRVGGMIHNADTGRGIIGVVDVTELMNDGNVVWIHNNKQGFQDCEQYVELERWLGSIFDSYWDDNFDSLQLEKDGSPCKPDHDWVQCNKCRKWRILPPNFDCNKLPGDWFCYMEPFNGKCEIPEQKVAPNIVNVSTTRHVSWATEKNVSEHGEGILLKSSNGVIRMSSPRKKRCSNNRTQENYEKSPFIMQPPKGNYNTRKNIPKMEDGARAPTFRKHGREA